jgi:hypothetical protein
MILAVLFVAVLQLAAAGSSDTLKSPYVVTRLEADSGHLFFYKCTLTTCFYVDSVKAYVRTNYYQKRTLENSCMQINQSMRPCIDTLQIMIKQAGTLDLQVVGPGIVFISPDGSMDSAGTQASFALQPGMIKTIIEKDTGSFKQDSMGKLLVKWFPGPTAALTVRTYGQSSSIARRGTVHLLDVLGRRIPPASRQARGVMIEGIGARIRELQPGPR